MSIYNKIKKLLQTGFFHIFGSSVINKVIGFLSAIVLLRVMTKAEYGIFTYAWNIFSLVLLASGMGIESGVLQVLSENSQDKKKFSRIYLYGMRYGSVINILLGGILLFIGLCIPMPIKGANTLMLLLCIMPIITLWFGMQCIYLRAEADNKRFARLSMINVLLIFVFSVLGALVCDAVGMVIGRYCAMILSVLFAFYIYKIPILNRKKGNDAVTTEEQKDLKRISTISMLNNSLSQVLYLLDVFVIGAVISNEETIASYKVATQIPTAFSFVPVAIVTYIYPYFANHHEDKKWCLKRYRQVLAGVGAMNLAISGVLIGFAPLIVSILFGKQYLDAVVPFRILSLSYFFSGTFRVIAGNLLVTQRKLKFNMFVAIFSGVVNIIGDVILVTYWGSNGAAVATLLVVLLTSFLNAGYLIYILKRGSE